MTDGCIETPHGKSRRSERTELNVTFGEQDQCKRVGLVVIYCDECGEQAFKRLMPANVEVFTTRAGADLEAYSRGRFEIYGGYEGVAASLPPRGRLDLVAFACTSGAIAGGDDAMLAAFATSHPGIPVTNPAAAAVHGLREAGITHVSLLTPYPPKIHGQLTPFFERNGFRVVSDGTFNVLEDDLAARISLEAYVDAGTKLVQRGKPQALFISCMALDVAPKLSPLSRAIGVPVFCSAQLFAWHALRLLDAEDAVLKTILMLGDSRHRG